jgi:hypothetical protein
MNQTDAHQVWRALTRCASELRGISTRLRLCGESDTAALIEAISFDVLGKWQTLRAPAPLPESAALEGDEHANGAPGAGN